MATAPAPTPTPASTPISILFVCLGNICRSTLAHAVFAHLTASTPHAFILDSAGTGAYHVGAAPDPRTTATLIAHNITGYRHGARKIQPQDLERFDYVMCMDKQNYKDVMRVRERLGKGKGKGMGKAEVRLFGDWGGRKGEVVEDPYYGGDEGFEIAYEQVVRFTRGFLKEVVGGEEGTERGKGRDEEVEVEEGVR